MIIRFQKYPSFVTSRGFRHWDKFSVVPGDGAFNRGISYLRTVEPVIFTTAGFLNIRLPGFFWSYTQHGNGSFHLNPENGKEYLGVGSDGESMPISEEVAGLAWSLAAFRLLGISSRGLSSRFVFLDKFNELQQVIDNHPASETIYDVFDECDWDARNG